MLKNTPEGRIYIPARIRHLVEGREVIAVVGTATITLFQPNARKEDVLKSLELARHEVELTYGGDARD
ncbi:MAG: hypothetical protein ACTSRV_10585 [Candidatus Freyarchaeota archaeon]